MSPAMSSVTLLSLYPPPGSRHAGRSGVASYTADLAHALSNAGREVTVVAPYDDGCATHEMDEDVIVHRAFPRGASALFTGAGAAIRTSSDVVHIQFETFLFGGASSLAALAPALARLRRAGKRVVVTMHHVIDPVEVDRRFVDVHGVRVPAVAARAAIRAVQDTIARLADRVIVHEPSFARSVRRARVIPHGVGAFPRTDRDRARARLGLGARPVALCFGFVAPYKGVETILEAGRLAGGEFDVVVAGGPHPRLGPAYLEDIQGRYRDVARFTGFVPEAEVADWFSACDVAVFPYPSPFGSSGALALALAYDTPALLSPALVESMQAPRELSLTTQPRFMADELMHVFTDPSRLAHVRAATRQLSQGRSWPAIARLHDELYEEVCDADRPAGRSVRSEQPRR